MMKHYGYLFLLGLLFISCAKEEPPKFDAAKNFEQELLQLQDFFKIPGLAVVVQEGEEIVQEAYFGVSDVERKITLDAKIVFPVASITKVFSGVVLMKLVEQGKLSLDDSLKTYFPNLPIKEPILVKHVLSHTSQGDEVGKHFYYSSRFGVLTKIIEEASGDTFEAYMKAEIFDPLGLKNTFLLQDSLQLAESNFTIAQPYLLEEGTITKGFVDYGSSSSAGIVSNLKDLSVFNNALDQDILISKESKELLFKGIEEDLPYGYGIFSQKFQGKPLIWGYGQYDCYSGLLLKVPSKNLSLILLANNNLMSDPARLIYGDVTSSLFALSFLKNYVYQFADMPLLETEASTTTEQAYTNQEFYRKKLLSQALATSFMARFDVKHMETSKLLLGKVFSEFPNYLDYADINLMHTLSFLKDVAFYRDMEPFNDFDQQIEKIGVHLLKQDPQNPYLHMYMGTYFDRKGDVEKAFFHFRQIVEANNFSRNWYIVEAENWLKETKPDYKISKAK